MAIFRQIDFYLFFRHFRQSWYFETLMCMILAQPSVHTQTESQVPQEELHLEQVVYDQAKNTEIFHYYDCTGRFQRDCRVYSYAKKYLQILYNIVSASI